MKNRMTGWAVLGLLALAVATPLHGGTCAVDIESPAKEFVVRNTSDQPVTPRIILRGWTIGEVFPPRHAAGLSLNGARLAPKMLTGATLILEPDGTGKWGYRTGFTDWIEDAPCENKRKHVEYRNVWWDADPPRPTRGREHAYVMHLSGRNGWTVPVRFPDGVTVRRLTIHAHRTGGWAGSPAVTRVLADTPASDVLSIAKGNDFPHTHTNLPGAFRVAFGCESPAPGGSLGLYRVWLEADLDAAALPRLALQPGVNVIRAADAPDSSHLWRVVLEHPALADNPEPEPRRKGYPAFVTNHVSRFRNAPARTGRPVPLDDFFPLGIYAGLRRETLDFIVDDMADHHCNMIYTSNNSIELLPDQLDLCERAGLKLLHQGGSPGSLYYLNLRYGFLKNDPEREIRHNMGNFSRTVEKVLPSLTNRWALLAWSPAEEQPPDTALLQRMSNAVALVRQGDPHHPIHMLYNNAATMRLDLPINRPRAATTDIYAYCMDVASTRETRDEAATWILARTAEFRRLGEPFDTPLWFMGQIWAEDAREDFNKAPYAPRGGMRFLRPADMRAQGWLALAAGARGLFFYAYQGDYQCRDSAFRATERWTAVGELFREVKPLTPLLLKLAPIEDSAPDRLRIAGTRVVVRPFTRRDAPELRAKGVYAIAVNWDPRERAPLHLAGAACEAPAAIWDMKRNRPATTDKPTTLEPGEGTLLWIGDAGQPAIDQAMMRNERARWARDYGL